VNRFPALKQVVMVFENGGLWHACPGHGAPKMLGTPAYIAPEQS
jgi:hypothetical protein